ncbi:MAG: L-threonylcarbamoyladenylate synthase [Alphaproteobacteria bacterium]
MTSQHDNIARMDKTGIDRAAHLLQQGDVVAFPTETVYGLGADATNDMAVARIYDVKQRPQFNPLIVHFRSADDVWTEAHSTATAKKLAAAFWPGPLTLVLKKSETCRLSPLVSAGLDSVAVRVPAHAGAQALLQAAGLPIAAPSANRSGAISPTSAEHVAASLGNRVPLILDGGSCSVGLESTIVDVTGVTPVLLRPGGVPVEALEDAAGRIALAGPTDTDAPQAPGQLLSHYAPNAGIRLMATDIREGELLLGFGAASDAMLNLSPTGDLLEAAANLFAMLHALDSMHPQCIAVSPIPDTGLGMAINDRLQRAAAPRQDATLNRRG